LLPVEGGGPSSDELAARVERYAARLPAPARHGLRTGLIGLQVLSLATTGRRLDRLTVAQREAVLDRVAAHPSTGLAFEGLKAIVLLVDGAHERGGEILSRATRSEPARPDAAMDVTPSTE
jgi:hypothetical protein